MHRAFIVVLIFIGFATALLDGQTLAVTGSITGAVADSTGAAVPEALVTARNEDTLAVRTTKTDQDGRFYFSTLPIGSYTLRVEKPGFTGVMVSRFLLSVGEVSVHE